MMKIKSLKFGIWVFLLFSITILNPILGQTACGVLTGNNTTGVNGCLSCTTRDTWEDSQWQFFRSTCEAGQTIQISLIYNGTLNIDLMLFVDPDPATNKKIAWDITHCQFDVDTNTAHQYSAFSAINTYNTSLTGPEQIIFTNDFSEITKDVYILLYVKEVQGGQSIGSANYFLTSTNNLQLVTSDQWDRCSTIQNAWILFAVGSVIFSIIFYKIVKRMTLPAEKKAELRLQKEQKQAEKAAKSAKNAKPVKGGTTTMKVQPKSGSTSMAARKSQSRR
jgi:hypothetical protein